MSADKDGPPLIETTPPPAVSNLRNRFEQLAVQSNSSPPLKSPIVRHSLLPSSPRPRLLDFSDSSPEPRPSIRPVSSISDLQSALKLAPSRPEIPSAPSSPLLRPTVPPSHSTSDTARSAALSRKPPPPPPLHNKPHVPTATRPDLAYPRSVPVLPSNGTARLSPVQVASPFDDDATPARSLRPPPSPPASRTASGSSSRTTVSHLADPHGRDVPRERRIPPPRPRRPSSHIDTQPASSPYIRPDHIASSESSLSFDHSSQNSSETDSPVDVSPTPSLPPRPGKPPRPPVRVTAGSRANTMTPPSSTSSFTPPPLPARKTSPLEEADGVLPSDSPSGSHTPSTLGRKTFGAHPPPPTRTIALGDKLPPPRRPPSGSSSESEDEDVKARVDLLPDSSRSSRRPPALRCHNHDTGSIHVPSYTGVAAVAGHTVVVGNHHHLRIYDLSVQEKALYDIDARSIAGEGKAKDHKVTCMEFRPTIIHDDRAKFLWVGTNVGHLFEVDVHSGAVTAVKFSAHSSPVTHIFRHAGAMASLDENGKVLVFQNEAGSPTDVSLSYTVPRIVRVTDKQDFARIFNGQLWTSSRDTVAGPGGRPVRGCAAVRTHNIFASTVISKSVAPSELIGSVLSGAVLPSQPDKVFLGHEGGHVTVWAVSPDGVIQCEEVVKVSASDVLCLEGVNNRLWAGGRQGTISAYDVAPRPWVMTNQWMAHQKLPLVTIAVDPYGIENMERLSVYSVGRDEKLYFWDGLLGIDWIDQTLVKREKEFSTFRDLNVLIISYNLDSAKPDAFTSGADNISFLEDSLRSVDDPDIIVFGFQELIDLESRKMAAKTVLLGTKTKTADGAISQKVTTSYKKWYDRLILAVRLAMPSTTPYTVIHTENLVGLFSCVFIKHTERNALKNISITTIKRGMGGRYGNKGGIISRFVIDDSSLCFINCHLAAGQSHVRQRNADLAAILEDKSVFPAAETLEDPLAFINGGDGTMVLDHEIVFLNGDMNYRIDIRRDVLINDIHSGNYAHLYAQDQLLKEMSTNRGFRLRAFLEGPLTFPPTYKYDRRSSTYDSSEKSRAPAWCDRILWRSNDQSRVEQMHYRRYEANVSDHRPISAGFKMTVKSVQHEVRAKVKSEVQGEWLLHQKKLLVETLKFYQEQMVVV
ncbi:hypothetical protein EUX98_g2010 [Antrodiella citrinella]|uniref:Inositol polyphosphate-related phosphatase domain-containing protein n=1 Tax=Antrodiella citrinella TaxID=2447956 RepID=A0A4V3XJ93_9APHY|nr:hypothetical protein EUX98_g2010 [Antrodiella citrinella]